MELSNQLHGLIDLFNYLSCFSGYLYRKLTGLVILLQSETLDQVVTERRNSLRID